jgi:hypothetical protein
MKNSPIEIDTWKRQGHSILWDVAGLNSFCKTGQAVSLRQFARLHASGWKGVDALLVRDRALVVAGLEGSLDTLDPKSAIGWLDHDIYPAVTSFQKEVAFGGSEAALIFWFADQRRFEYRQAEQALYWKCSAAHGRHEISIGRCLWNGSEPNSQEIREKATGPVRFAGYYLQRIS